MTALIVGLIVVLITLGVLTWADKVLDKDEGEPDPTTDGEEWDW